MILLLISFVWNIGMANDDTLQLNDFKNLGNRLAASGDDFGAYLFRLGFYHLCSDSSEKLSSGLDAIDVCMRAKRFVEAERLLNLLHVDFPDNPNLQKYLIYKFGYNLTLAGLPERGNLYLTQLEEEPEYRNAAFFLGAYNCLRRAQPEAAFDKLSMVDSVSRISEKNTTSIMRMINEGPSFRRRHASVAVLLSACAPGLGQAYAGHHFDALQSLVFNLVIGGASYLSWKYEVVEKKPGTRTFGLPIISTSVFSVFYLANLWNAANASNRYNRFKELRYYESILEKFRIGKTEQGAFLDIGFSLD